ncbi:OLC1v1026454C3 [Oldenlandia corymbosa var. corymbosa]|uniref:OLC1v1026454C3 n=1 Tax=Oldenlandia corymbosa var. corymbosa TaxID=529605 RepID=A0AAV1C716_OLDCO|nr:OLC1v1026454C3 [Oldenlandia corymbosa var. corymbosa]
MWRKTLITYANSVLLRCRSMATRPSPDVSAAVNSILLRSLKDHYMEVSKMTPPPKVNPPAPFTVVKGSLDSGGPVLKRSYKDEEVSVSVMRLANIIPEGGDDDDDDDDDSINQLFVHVNISKPGQADSLHFLCGLYPDALGIHSVSLRPKVENSEASTLEGLINKYNGPTFEALDERVRDSLHGYIQERGIDESLFPFLQAWQYVKDHRNLMQWFKTIGTFVHQGKEVTTQAQ